MKITEKRLYLHKNFSSEIVQIASGVGIAFITGLIIIAFASDSPGETMYAFFASQFSSNYTIATLITNMIPLIITGLALSISFQSRIWNLAAEGQVYCGAFIGIVAGLFIPDIPPVIAVCFMMCASMASGAAVGLIPVILKIKLKVNELITSFMMSLITIPIVNYFLTGPMLDEGQGINTTRYVNKSFLLPNIFPGFKVNIGLIIAVILIGAVYLFLYRTVSGTHLRIYGYNREFAIFEGINEGKTALQSMLISGALCGLAGWLTSMGVYHGRMIEFSTYGFGWNGIAVALVARFNPIAVFPAAFLLSYLVTGANLAGLITDIPPELSQVIISIIYYLITAQALLNFLSSRRSPKT